MRRHRSYRFVSYIAIVAATFLCAGLITAFLMASSARQKGVVSDRERLIELGTQVAARLDPKDLSSLHSVRDAGSPAFARVKSQLEEFRRSVPDVAECYTIRYGESGAQALVDTGRKIGNSRSALFLSHELLEPLDSVLSAGVISAMMGQVQFDSEPSREFGTEYRRVYVPVMGADHKTVAVLVLSSVDRPISYYFAATMATTAPGWVVATMFVLIVTFIVARALDDFSKKETIITAGAGGKVMSWIVTDSILIVLALLAVSGLRIAYANQRQCLSTLVASESRSNLLTAKAVTPNVSNPMSLKAITAGLQAETEIQRDMKQQLDRSEWAILGGFMVVGLLAVGTLIALRASVRAQMSLKSARAEADWHRTQHEQIIGGLPIGFYTAENGQLVFSNPSMDLLLDRSPSETAQEAFVRTLHDDDVDGVAGLLRDAEENAMAFSRTLRLGENLATQRFLETHGVPFLDAEGSTGRVVGFAMDVTDRVRAQMLAERRENEFGEANEQLRKALEAGEHNFEATVHALVKAVEAKDVYTAGHSERVMHYSVQIGQAMGLSDAQLRTLRMGTLIHDVGKIGIPDAILGKPDRLTIEEFAMIKQHPDIGVRMIEGIPAFADCIPIVLYHHERLDGRGYPFGLTGETIPILARIAAVADCYDAMTSDRAYRKGRSPVQALSELAADAERGALDGKIVSIFADIVLNGSVPELRNAA